MLACTRTSMRACGLPSRHSSSYKSPLTGFETAVPIISHCLNTAGFKELLDCRCKGVRSHRLAKLAQTRKAHRLLTWRQPFGGNHDEFPLSRVAVVGELLPRLAMPAEDVKIGSPRGLAGPSPLRWRELSRGLISNRGTPTVETFCGCQDCLAADCLISIFAPDKECSISQGAQSSPKLHMSPHSGPRSVLTMHSTKPARSTLLMMGRSYRSRSNANAFSAMGLTDSVKATPASGAR